MKTTLKTKLLLLVALFAFANSNAQNDNTFYVCSNTSFTMVPDVTSHSNYEWYEISSGLLNLVATTQNATVTSPTLSGTTYDSVQYTLMVKDTSGCWSEPDTFTVYVLPPVQVSISGASSSYCASVSISDTLTANIGTLTLPIGVTAGTFAWTENSTPVGTNSSQLVFTSGSSGGATVYEVTVSYDLPVGNGGSKLSTCDGTANVTITVTNAPTTPGISIQ